MTAKRYSQDHEWISFDDSTGVGAIGITDYAQKNLGDVVFVEIAGKGTEVAKQGAFPLAKPALAPLQTRWSDLFLFFRMPQSPWDQSRVSRPSLISTRRSVGRLSRSTTPSSRPPKLSTRILKSRVSPLECGEATSEC